VKSGLCLGLYMLNIPYCISFCLCRYLSSVHFANKSFFIANFFCVCFSNSINRVILSVNIRADSNEKNSA
jgi:hypothetical protein